MPRTKLHQVAQESLRTQVSDQDLQLTYTAIALGKELGITGKSVTKWWEKISQTYYWCIDSLVEDPQAGNLKFTQHGLQVFREYQQACSIKVPVTNEDSVILRGDNGLPLMQHNPNRVSFSSYQGTVWSKFNRFPSPSRADEPTEIVPIADHVYDVEVLESQEQHLCRVENTGDFINGIFDEFREAGSIAGDAAVEAFSEGLTARFQTGVKEVYSNLGKALKQTGKGGKSGRTSHPM